MFKTSQLFYSLCVLDRFQIAGAETERAFEFLAIEYSYTHCSQVEESVRIRMSSLFSPHSHEDDFLDNAYMHGPAV